MTPEPTPVTLNHTAAILVALAAAFSYLNYRFLRLPAVVGMMLIALLTSALVLGTIHAGLVSDVGVRNLLASIDFNQALMDGMLAFLLFAGALDVDLTELARQRWPIAFLATVATVISTALIGFGMFAVFDLLGRPVPLSWCLVFGALISPTDPIAVLAIMRTAGAPKALEMKIAGESLFNDGVGVVVFLEILGIASGAVDVSAAQVATFFVREALGGAVFGFVTGWAVFRLLASVDDYEVEVLLTVGLAMGGYALASALHLSGPIATVVAGLLIGNHGRRHAMSQRTREHLDTFWKLVDSMLNAVLFALIGLEMIIVPVDPGRAGLAVLAIAVVLLARFLSVLVPTITPYLRRCFSGHDVKVLTWGGLRGGISIALALGLPDNPYRNTFITLTYACVVFAILVQGLTVARLFRGGENEGQPRRDA